MVAPFINVTVITEQELPRSKCPSGFMIVAIEGLCPGMNTYLRNKAVGHLAFIRTEKGGVDSTMSEQQNKLV